MASAIKNVHIFCEHSPKVRYGSFVLFWTYLWPGTRICDICKLLELQNLAQFSGPWTNIRPDKTAEACRVQGLVFLPFAMETLGGLHSGAAAQVKQLAAVLARSKGLVEGEVTAQLFGKLSLTLMRGNALMISSRCQDDNFPPAEIDGVE